MKADWKLNAKPFDLGIRIEIVNCGCGDDKPIVTCRHKLSKWNVHILLQMALCSRIIRFGFVFITLGTTPF